MSENIFQIAPAGSVSLWILVPVVLLMLGFALFFINVMYYAKNSTVRIKDNELVIKGGLYGRSIPLGELHLEEAQVVNLYRDRSFQLRSRQNGVGLPGYNSGWFRLQDGQKVLAFVTDQTEVLYIPTDNGYSLMLTLENPGRFLESISADV